MCLPDTHFLFFTVDKRARKRRRHPADQIVNITRPFMEINFPVRRRALLIPGIKILRVPSNLDVSAFIRCEQLTDQPFRTDHILVLRRADIVVGRDGKHLCGKYIGAVCLLVIAEQIQVKAGIPQNHRPIQWGTAPSEWQIAAVSVKTVNSVPKAVQHRLWYQPLPPHGNTDLKLVLLHKFLCLLVRQKIAVRLMHRNPVLLRQHRQSLIPRNLILLRHLRADRNHQIHRTDLLLNKIHNIFGRIFHSKHDDFVFHATYLSLLLFDNLPHNCETLSSVNIINTITAKRFLTQMNNTLPAFRSYLHFRYSLYQSIASPIPFSKS